MHINTFIEELESICEKGQVGASYERIRKIRNLIRIYQSEHIYPWYMKLALYFYEK